MSQFVRVKRKTQTWFIHCDHSDLIKTIKGEIARIETKRIEDLQNEMSLSGLLHTVQNNDILILVYKNPDGSWEPPCIEKPVYERDSTPIALPASMVEYLDDMNPSVPGMGCFPWCRKKKEEEEIEDPPNTHDILRPEVLDITVSHAKGLIGGGNCEPYVLVELIEGGLVTFKQKSSKEGSVNPTWNQVMEDTVLKTGELAAVRFTVFDKVSLGADQFLGYSELPLPTRKLVELLVCKEQYTLPLTGRPGNISDDTLFRNHRNNLGTLNITIRASLPPRADAAPPVPQLSAMLSWPYQESGEVTVPFDVLEVTVAGALALRDPTGAEVESFVEVVATGVRSGASLPRITSTEKGNNPIWPTNQTFSWDIYPEPEAADDIVLTAIVKGMNDQELGRTEVLLGGEELRKALCKPHKRALYLKQLGDMQKPVNESFAAPETALSVVSGLDEEKDKEKEKEKEKEKKKGRTDTQPMLLYLVFRTSTSSMSNELAESAKGSDPTDEEETTYDETLARTQQVDNILSEDDDYSLILKDSTLTTPRTHSNGIINRKEELVTKLAAFLKSVGSNVDARKAIMSAVDIEHVLCDRLQQKFPQRAEEVEFLREYWLAGRPGAMVRKKLPETPAKYGPNYPSEDDPSLPAEERLKRAMLREKYRDGFMVVPSRRNSIIDGEGLGVRHVYPDVIHREGNFVAQPDEMMLLPPPPPTPLKAPPSVESEMSYGDIDKSEETRIRALEKELSHVKGLCEQVMREKSTQGFKYVLPPVEARFPSANYGPPSVSMSVPMTPHTPRQATGLRPKSVEGYHALPKQHKVSERDFNSWLLTPPKTLPFTPGDEPLPQYRLSPTRSHQHHRSQPGIQSYTQGNPFHPISPTSRPSGWRPMSPAKTSSSRKPWR